MKGHKREGCMYLRVLPVGRPQTQARCMCVPSRQLLLYMVPELDLDDTSLICRWM